MQHGTVVPQQFCLRWNNYQNNLTVVFEQLLQTESFVDVTLACDGQFIKAHKVVLSACSPYFQTLLVDNPCQHPIVIMKDIKWSELKAAVEFMYKGEINVSQEQIGPLLKIAEILKIRGLADVKGEEDIGSTTASGEVIARPTSKPPPIPPSSTPQTPTTPTLEWGSGCRSTDSASSQLHQQQQQQQQQQNSQDAISDMQSRPPPAKRRRPSGERNSNMSSPADSAGVTDLPEPPSLEMSPTGGVASIVSTPLPTPSSSTIELPLPLTLPPALPPAVSQHSASNVDDLEIKPGIAEMIREEERAKMLESSHAWLGASTSSIAEHPTQLKLKTPTWTQDKLKEAIDAVTNQRMRFTQASAKYGIPKGTLYDNILGKSKRMAVLEQAALTQDEEEAVLEFCCDISLSIYNRRTKKSLKEVLDFVTRLRRMRHSEFTFTGLSGYRWWWAFSDSYQYQLQSMWQKCWNTNQSLVHNLRFRERGPLKSWRPETMAEAIFSVLKEGLSLSQAARKYDIPYPTFVLYANRVHNMLGPSADGGSDLRPKGRGRPQRILLGVWPDEHIRGVIRAVVFRDSHQLKDDPHLPYPRLHDGVTIQSYPNNACSNGADPNVSPGAAAAAAVAAVAQGLRQQMCSMVAAAHNQSSAHDTNPVASLVNSLALASHCGSVPLPSNGAPPMSMSHLATMRSLSSPAGSIQDLRISPSESAMESPISSPLGLTVSSSMEPAINMNIGNSMEVGIGVSGMTYKPARPFTSPRPENLFQEDIDDLVKPIHSSATPRPKDTMTTIKMEPLTECRGD